MKLYDMVQQVDVVSFRDQLMLYMTKHYEHKYLYYDESFEEMVAGLVLVFQDVKKMNGVESLYRISLRPCLGYDDYEVVGYKDGDDNAYALSGISWDEWLGMEVDDENIRKLGILMVVLHCILEMTAYGFDMEVVKKNVERIYKIIVERLQSEKNTET